jgi:hypothetical protein
LPYRCEYLLPHKRKPVAISVAIGKPAGGDPRKKGIKPTNNQKRKQKSSLYLKPVAMDASEQGARQLLASLVGALLHHRPRVV